MNQRKSAIEGEIESSMDSPIELTYQLAELPSAQHRAGLAGLVLMVREVTESQRDRFAERFDGGAILECENLTEFGVTLRFNKEGLAALFDLTYAAFEEERATETKIKKFERVEEVEKTDKKGNKKLVKRYYYKTTVPEGAFLPAWDTSNDGSNQGIWIKLWRDMMWNIVRGVPTTRNPYKNRVDDASYSKDVEIAWKDLQHPEKAIAQTGQYYLGAASTNPENILIKDKARYQFLLHFWVFAAQVYCPMTLDKEGIREQAGYILAIPDIADLENFCEEFEYVLRSRSSKTWRYLPKYAVIDLPEEGAFDLLNLLKKRVSHEVSAPRTNDLVLGVELIHAEKAGNSGVKIRSVSYVDPIQAQIDCYSQIRDAYWCPWFRKQLLLNLVRSQPKSLEPDAPLDELPAWYEFDALLSRVPRKWLEDKKNYFSHDARELFTEKVEVKTKKEIRDYAQIVYEVCQSYVLGKLRNKYEMTWNTAKKYPVKWDKVKKLPAKPEQKISQKEFDEKKYKIANEAFLAVRSRTESQVFIDYFVSTLYPFVKASEFADFADSLFNKTDEIRALTLLALSSQFPLTPKSENSNNDKTDTADG
jgi:CRISPR-associated protein Cmx8